MKSQRKNVLIRISAIVAAALLALTMPVGRVNAKEYVARADIDTDRSGSLTITHKSVDGDLMEGVTSQLYLVATIDADGQYTITDEFKGCFENADFFNNGFDYDQWKDCVQYDEKSDSDILDRYIKEKSLSPVKEGKSDNNGKTYYTDLELGVYYVHSDEIVKDEHTHYFVNFVYPVPILEKDETSKGIRVNYAPEAEPKKSKVWNGVVVHCGIRKQWNDSESNNRPRSVTFEIYCDGEFMKRITLSSENGWQDEWEGTGIHDYDVKEVDAGEGYTGTITVKETEKNHYIYTCVNSYSGDNPPPPPDNPPPDNPPPDNPPPNTPPSNPPGVPDIPAVLGAIRQLPQVLGARRLPQTGQLWWPLPILVIAGIFFIVKGIKKNAKMKAQNN